MIPSSRLEAEEKRKSRGVSMVSETRGEGRGVNYQRYKFDKPVSQSCAAYIKSSVAKSEKFWWATGQSNLADKKEDCSIGQSAIAWVRKPNFDSFSCGQPFICQVWMSSCPPKFSLLSTAHDCETGFINSFLIAESKDCHTRNSAIKTDRDKLTGKQTLCHF